jgi:hypothetical protein
MATSKKQTSEAPPEIVALYDKMVASCPEVPRKGVTLPNTSHNGNMFSFVHPSGAIALRLPKGEREAFVEKYQTRLFDGYGLVQKEYVLVPRTLLEETDELVPYFRMSFEYCKTLKPKKTQE